MVDSFYMRVLFELGILGTFVFIYCMYKVSKISGALTLFVLLTCLTLDPFSSVKICMAAFIIYSFHAQKKVKGDSNNEYLARKL